MAAQPQLTREHLLATCNTKKNTDVVDWTQISEDMRSWIAGQLDGNGFIAAESSGILITITKPERGLACLEHLRSTIGGSILKGRYPNGNRQVQLVWKLRGDAAIALCKDLADYIFLKRPQMIVGATVPRNELEMTKLRPVIATDKLTGEQTVYGSLCEAARVMNTSPGNICNAIKGVIKSIGGHTWEAIPNLFNRDDAIAKCDAVNKRLKDLKRIEHEPIIGPMSLPYVAGFVDADACLIVSGKNSLKCTISKKHPAICDALCAQFGGSVKKNIVYIWSVSGPTARSFLREVVPYMIEKREQAELLLNMKPGDGADVKIAMRALKGDRRNKKPN